MTLLDILLQVWSFDGVKFLVGHICINVVVAIATAVKIGSFDLRKISEFLARKLLPYVSIYYISKLFGGATGLTWLAPVVWGIIETSLLGDLIENLLLLKIPFPERVFQLLDNLAGW